MQVPGFILWCCGGACLANALRHCISGLMGRAFQIWFARPRRYRLLATVPKRYWGGLADRPAVMDGRPVIVEQVALLEIDGQRLSQGIALVKSLRDGCQTDPRGVNELY